MILGQGGTDQLFAEAAAARAAADAKWAKAMEPTVTGSVAAAVVPGFILGLVKRDRHPIVWWGFGVLPLALAGSRLVRALGKKGTAA